MIPSIVHTNDTLWNTLLFARSGDVEIRRSIGKLSGGFSHWTTVTAGGVTEAMVSAITNDDATAAKTNAGVYNIPLY